MLRPTSAYVDSTPLALCHLPMGRPHPTWVCSRRRRLSPTLFSSSVSDAFVDGNLNLSPMCLHSLVVIILRSLGCSPTSYRKATKAPRYTRDSNPPNTQCNIKASSNPCSTRANILPSKGLLNCRNFRESPFLCFINTDLQTSVNLHRVCIYSTDFLCHTHVFFVLLAASEI